MIRTYRKTATIKAEQFDGSDEMIQKYGIIPVYDKNSENEYWQPVFPCSVLMTKEGAMSIDEGDWIATGVAGEHWVIQDSIFKKTYVEVDK